ncbi:MAG TPA: TIGR03435 family protein [Bryobacteraceae bacterium]|jgi:uncharacterized protein (TIGR03435 family)|nr:TIGR03435 family protein [Bryobacteraceae bacterium]
MKRLLLVFVGTAAAFGQSSPAFEVASIKPYRPGDPTGVRVDGAHFSSSGIPLRNLIYSSYGVSNWRIFGGPAWLDEAYDIQATLPPNTAPAQLNEMMRMLLAERFGLAIHRETREISVYALVAGKNPPKLKTSSADRLSVKAGRGRLELHRVSTEIFVTYLWSSRATDRPVIDATGLKGFFDIDFDWDPANDPAKSGQSVFTSIQEELGLWLESRRSPFECIMIDRIERPSAN